MHEVTWLIRSCDLVVLGPELLLRTPYRLSSSRMCSRNLCSSFAFFWHFSIRNICVICLPAECVCVLVCLSYSSVSVTAFSCDHTSDECCRLWQGQRQKRLEERQKRLEREVEERRKIDIEEALFQAEKRKAAIEKAKLQQYYQTDRVKRLHVSAYDMLLQYTTFLKPAASSGKRLCVGLVSVCLSVRLSVLSIDRWYRYITGYLPAPDSISG